MTSEEKDKILASARMLEQWEKTPAPWEDPYSDMTETEKSKLIELLIDQRDESRRREEAASRKREELQKRISELMEQHTRQMASLMDQICELTKLLKEKDIENAKLKGRVDLSNRNKYSRTSQKKSDSHKDDGNKPTSHTDTW